MAEHTGEELNMPAPSGAVVSDDQKAATSWKQPKIFAGSLKPHITLMGKMNSRADWLLPALLGCLLGAVTSLQKLIITEATDIPAVCLPDPWNGVSQKWERKMPTNPWRTPFPVYCSLMISNHGPHEHSATSIWKSCVLPMPKLRSNWYYLWAGEDLSSVIKREFSLLYSAQHSPLAVVFLSKPFCTLKWWSACSTACSIHIFPQQKENREIRHEAGKAALIQAAAGWIRTKKLTAGETTIIL